MAWYGGEKGGVELFPAVHGVHEGDVQDGYVAAWGTPPGGVPGGVSVARVSWWWSVCRGLFGDGGAGGGFVGDGLAGGVGGEQGGDGEPVDGAGHAAGVGVDRPDCVIAE